MSICCLNPDCSNPLNPDTEKFCQTCGAPLTAKLRNRFRVMRVLSDEGGFGRTYLAQDIDKLNDLCVIKQLSPKDEGSWSLKKALELFKKEAKRLQELGENSQIPTLIAYFEQDSYLYLVQQYIEGENLLRELEAKKLLRKEKPPYAEAEVRQILIDLLTVLKFIHQRGVIHRDIKPQNLVRRKSDNLLCLIDFGSSKQFSAQVQSKEGTSIGSHGYSPIEQIRDGVAYPASDLFSLGATCFHLLTGISPFRLWTEYGYGWVNCWREYLPVPLSDNFANILEKLLKKEVSQRYQSSEEVLNDINEVNSSYPIPHPRKILKNKKFSLIAVSLFTISLLFLGDFALRRSGLLEASKGIFFAQTDNAPLPPDKWRYSNGYATNYQLALTIRGFANPVMTTAITPDRSTIISNSDRAIKLWSLATGQEIATLYGHTGRINTLAIDGRGQILASGSDDKTIKLWNIATGREITTLSKHTAPVRSLVFSPDGKTLASAGDDRTLILWNVQQRTPTQIIRAHTASIRSLAISPNSNLIATGSDDTTVKIWQPGQTEPLLTLTDHSQPVTAIAFHPNGTTLASASRDKTVKLWNIQTGRQIRQLKAHTDDVTSLTFSPDGMVIATASHDKTIKLWNAATGAMLKELPVKNSNLETITFSADGTMLLSGGDDKTLRIWELGR